VITHCGVLLLAIWQPPQDITKEFPMALELGAFGPEVLQQITAVEGLSGSE
jgi:hypothetical protein